MMAKRNRFIRQKDWIQKSFTMLGYLEADKLPRKDAEKTENSNILRRLENPIHILI